MEWATTAGGDGCKRQYLHLPWNAQLCFVLSPDIVLVTSVPALQAPSVVPRS